MQERITQSVRQSGVRNWIGAGVMACALAVLATLTLLSPRVSEARQDPAASNKVWEYNVVIVAPASLQTQLTGLGNDRWEVVSVSPLESSVDPSMNQMVKLRVDSFQVVSRRAK